MGNTNWEAIFPRSKARPGLSGGPYILDLRSKAITATWNRHQKRAAAICFAKDSAESRHMNPQVSLVYERVRPDGADELLFADEISGTFDKDCKNGNCAAAKSNGVVVLCQQSLREL
jgi:hypothetical protein